MYFKITQDIVSKAIKEDQICSGILDVLSWAILQHKHVVFGDAAILREIVTRQNKNWTGFEYVYNEYSTIGAVVATIDWHVEFVLDKTSYKDTQHKVVYISVQDVSKFEICKETHFLCENIKDIDFYKYILKYYQRLHKCPCGINYYPILGGGGSTFSVYENEIKEKKAFVLCVTDGDQKYKNGSLGDTWNNVKRVEDRYNAFNSYCYHLSKVSEVENLIPISIYKQYVTVINDQEQKEKVDRIVDLSHICADKMAYFDFKSGITLHLLQDKNPNNNWKEVVKSLIPDIDDKIKSNEEKCKEIDTAFQTIGLENCSKLRGAILKDMEKSVAFICGLGERILDNILNRCSNDLDSITEDLLYDFQKVEFETVGYLIHNWACCLDVVRS